MPIDKNATGRAGRPVYDSGQGHWIRLSPVLWLAPNGDTVSVRSMTPELRVSLAIRDELDGGPNRNAIRHLRTILDR